MPNKELEEKIEQIFADVAGLTPKEHKNVLGDKWKFINALVDGLSKPPAPVLNGDEIIKAINDGRKKNKRDGRDGVLVSIPPEYAQDKKYALEAQRDSDHKYYGGK